MPQCRESMQHKRSTDVIISVWGDVVLKSAWGERPQIARSHALHPLEGKPSPLAFATRFLAFATRPATAAMATSWRGSGFAAWSVFWPCYFLPLQSNGSWLPARHQPAAQLPSQVRCEVETGVSRVSVMGVPQRVWAQRPSRENLPVLVSQEPAEKGLLGRGFI